MPNATSLKNRLGYFPAELKTSPSGWRIVYQVEDPATRKMVRKVIKMNRINNKVERKQYCRRVIKSLNEKLADGWNPFLEESASKGHYRIREVVEIFLNDKSKELRYDTVRTYKSYVSLLLVYLNHIEKDLFAVSFTDSMAQNFMRWIYNRKKIGNNTFNNYLLGYRVIFNWLVKHDYAPKNPFNSVLKKKSQKKRRRILEPEERKRLYDYYADKNERFLSVILLAYHCLIRPTEITHLKPSDVDFHNKVITPPHTKNGNRRVIATPDHVIDLLEQIGVRSQDPNKYIFSSGFRPGKHKLCPRKISREWNNGPRKILGFGKDLTFYSLRDSGIVQMLRDGIRIEEVQNHADHKEISTTQKYINIAFPSGVESVREKSSSFC